MMLAGFFLLLLTDGVYSDHNCSYQDVLNHLNLTKNNELYSMTRPVKNYTQPTEVFLEVLLYAILDVDPLSFSATMLKSRQIHIYITTTDSQAMEYLMIEPELDEGLRNLMKEFSLLLPMDISSYAPAYKKLKRETEQTFVPYVWIFMSWKNEHIKWDPEDFCGLDRIVVPADIFWKPDLTVEEMTEKDKAPPSPYLAIDSDGFVERRDNQVLVSSCRMQVYNFPFDIQSCNLSFKSVVHNVKELYLEHGLSSALLTEWSQGLETQYEWLLLNQTVTKTYVDKSAFNQSMIIYTIKMKRRSILYIVNFLLPIMFFLCLDLASFLISDRGGEKLSFKVTVLLAVTVMQLILNDILPSSSDRAPLIAVYCMGVFGLMLLSLLETIVVMHLMEKDSASRDTEADGDRSLSEDCGDKHGKANIDREEKKWTCACISDVSADETPSELLKVSSSQLTAESHASEKLSDDLREVVKTLALLLNSRTEDEKPGYWTRMAKTINRVFFILYITAASLFLVIMFLKWNITY